MEAVSAVVEAAVAAARVNAVAVWRARRVCLNPIAAEDRKGEQGHCNAGGEKEP